MRTTFLLAFSALISLVSCAQATDCPSDAQVQAALQHAIADETWSPGERDIWKITDVSGFEFGAMKTGHVIKKQVEFGRDAQDVCPVRIEYSYKVTHADGRIETTAKGKGETHLFYKNGFDEWVYKVERS